MKITATFSHDGDPAYMPRLVAAYDEFTFDDCCGPPDDYKTTIDHAKFADPSLVLREVTITVPDSAIEALFAPAPVAGTVTDR